MKVKFNLNNFEPIPEGERVLEITSAECKPSGLPKEMNVTFRDVETSRTLKNRYNFDSTGGLAAMGFLCRIALDLPDMDDFETRECGKLVGKQILCEIAHTEGTQPREDGTFPIFANIKKVISLVGDAKEQTMNDIGDFMETATSPRAQVTKTFNDLD